MELTFVPVQRLSGRVPVPGDKSISHRAALLGALAAGTTAIHGYLAAADTASTIACLRALGIAIDETPGTLRVHGGPLRPAPEPLEAGNSGTTMRLLAGILAAQPFASELRGDASLSTRPMDRVIQPLRQMGAEITALGGGRYPPLQITGQRLHGIHYRLPVASAQVKSALLLAALFADGPTTIEEPIPTRDHSERMLAYLGAKISRHGSSITLRPGHLTAREIRIPGDLSAAAFVLAAAAARPGSEVIVEGVGVNPTRTGLLDVLRAMGARIAIRQSGEVNNEPIGTITIRGGPLHRTTIGGTMIPAVIDELPVLAVVAATAEGSTDITDAAELRVKESDRIAAVARGLRTLGIAVDEHPDGITIHGGRLQGGRINSAGDHRIAMAFAVAGVLASAPVTIEGAEAMAISFPEFTQTLEAVSVP